MSRLNLLVASVLVVACGTTSYTVMPEPQAVAAPGNPWPSVGYWGPHPVPAGFGGGFDYTEGPHTHPYTPEQPDLYTSHDGYFVFLGDPAFYGYDGPMRWYAGPHVLRYPWGEVVCPIDGPHRHWEYSTVYVYETDYVVVDGFWIYLGLWPLWWHHDHVVHLHHYWPRHYHDHYAQYVPRAHAAVEAAPPRHGTSGHVGHEPGTPGVHDVPPATGGRDSHPGLLPAYDENRRRQADPNAPDQTGIYHGRETDGERGVDRDTPERAVPGGSNLPPAWNDGRKALPASRVDRDATGDRGDAATGLPLPVERGALEPLDETPGADDRTRAVTPGSHDLPPAWNDGREPAGGRGWGVPRETTPAVDARGSRPAATGGTDRPATNDGVRPVTPSAPGSTQGRGTWQPPTGSAGANDGGGHLVTPRAEARDVAVPRKKNEDVPPRYNVDPKPATSWGGANRAPAAANKLTAPAQKKADDEEWKKSSRPKATPSADRARSGGSSPRPSGRKR